MFKRTFIALSVVVLSIGLSLATDHDQKERMKLFVDKGLGQDEVVLSYDGRPTFIIYRSENPFHVARRRNEIARTDSTSFTDAPFVADLYFFRVGSTTTGNGNSDDNDEPNDHCDD